MYLFVISGVDFELKVQVLFYMQIFPFLKVQVLNISI